MKIPSEIRPLLLRAWVHLKYLSCYLPSGIRRFLLLKMSTNASKFMIFCFNYHALLSIFVKLVPIPTLTYSGFLINLEKSDDYRLFIIIQSQLSIRKIKVHAFSIYIMTQMSSLLFFELLRNEQKKLPPFNLEEN